MSQNTQQSTLLDKLLNDRIKIVWFLEHACSFSLNPPSQDFLFMIIGTVY